MGIETKPNPGFGFGLKVSTKVERKVENKVERRVDAKGETSDRKEEEGFVERSDWQTKITDKAGTIDDTANRNDDTVASEVRSS